MMLELYVDFARNCYTFNKKQNVKKESVAAKG